MNTRSAKSTLHKILLIFATGILLISCDDSYLKKTPIENFEGIWELQGRPMFDGVRIKIEENNKGDLVGKVTRINDNKYVKMFIEPNDIWVADINRISNYEFELTENKIGSELFAIYGLETTKEYNAQFIHRDTIGLAASRSNPSESKIRYNRITNK